MKISITGGNGFIGRKLVKILIQEGHDVTVLSRRDSASLPAKAHLVKGDLASVNCELGEFVKGCDVLFHCAGELHDVSVMQALHVAGTQRLVDAVLQESSHKGRVIHWVQLSSVGAYGFPSEYINTERIVTEDTPPQPLGIYEVTKTQSDEIVLHASEGGLLTYSMVRPSKVFGLDKMNSSLHSLKAMVRRGLFFYIGPPGAIATYIHVDDVVEVLRLCGTDVRAKGHIFNISNDCLLEEMMAGIAATLGVRPPRLRFPEFFVRTMANLTALVVKNFLTQDQINGLVRRTRYPYLKLERVLNFTPRVPVPSTIGNVL